MTAHRVPVARRPTSLADYMQPAGQPMDYGTEPVERHSGRRLLLRGFVRAVVYAAVLWVAGSIALSTVPNPSQVVYVEGECLAY